MKLSARRKARQTALQALYSWYISQNSIEEVELAFVSDDELIEKGTDKPYFSKLLRGCANNLESIDNELRPFLDRSEQDVDPIERSLLRLAAYELIYQPDVPFKVVINEWIEVAKVFGSDDSHKYVNGILDKLSPKLGRK